MKTSENKKIIQIVKINNFKIGSVSSLHFLRGRNFSFTFDFIRRVKMHFFQADFSVRTNSIS